MDKVVAKSTALGYLVTVAASAALVSVGLFFLIREGNKKDRAERMKLYIIMGIVFAVLGSVLLLGITLIFVMSGLTQKMFIGEDEAMIMAYLAGVVLATTVLCIGVFMLIDQLEKNKERRDLTKFILSIVFIVLGSVLLIAIGVVFLAKSGRGGSGVRTLLKPSREDSASAAKTDVPPVATATGAKQPASGTPMRQSGGKKAGAWKVACKGRRGIQSRRGRR